MHSFMMLFDDSATPMLEAVMASGMALRFPDCGFRAQRTKNPEYADIIIPIGNAANAGGKGDAFIVSPPPSDLTDSVQEAFDDLLREARLARPS